MAYTSLFGGLHFLQLPTSESADAFGRAIEIDPSVNQTSLTVQCDPALMPIKQMFFRHVAL